MNARTAIPWVLMLILFMIQSVTLEAAVDQAKYRKWARKNLQTTVDLVKQDGKAPATRFKLVNKYDTNGDGMIDRSEVGAVEQALEELE